MKELEDHAKTGIRISGNMMAKHNNQGKLLFDNKADSITRPPFLWKHRESLRSRQFLPTSRLRLL